MCEEPSWRELTLGWSSVGATALVCAVVFTAIGWYGHAFRQWMRRTALHLKFVKPLARGVAYTLGVLLIGGWLAYSWLLV